MKKTLLNFLFLVGGIVAVQAQQLPNYGFNNWKSACASTESLGDYNEMRQRPGVEPAEWNGSSVNQAVKFIWKQEKKQQLIYNDNNSVKMVNTFVGVASIGSVAPGFITFGTPWVYATSSVDKCDGGVYGGINFSHKPDAITGTYKRTDATGEKSHIIAYLWNGTFTSKVGQKGSPSTDRDNVDKAVMGMVTPSAAGTLVASCDYTFTATANNDWETITVPLDYKVGAGVNPTMMNVVISGGDYWDRDAMEKNTTLLADDVRFVYYSTLKTLSYDGTALTVPADGATLDMSSVKYDAEKVAYTLNGQTATATTSYDEATAVLTITVSNVDNDIDGQSSHTYYVQFEKPHTHAASVFTADGASINAACDCGYSFGSVMMVLPSDLVYDGQAKTVSLEGAIEGMENPVVVYSSETAPVNVGTYTASITLGGVTAVVEYTIEAKSIAGAVVGEFAEMTYTGAAQTPAAVVTLEGLGEVTGTWSEVLNVGDKSTFTATGNFTGSVEAEVGMLAKEIEASDVVLEADTVVYTGEAIEPVVTVTIDEASLVEGTDYVVAYSDNVNEGTATVTVTAMGNYSGTVTLTYVIVLPANIAPVQSQVEVVYYDLCGRRVLQPIKGKIYIANGKKVIF